MNRYSDGVSLPHQAPSPRRGFFFLVVLPLKPKSHRLSPRRELEILQDALREHVKAAPLPWS